MSVRRLLTGLAVTILTLGGVTACGDKKNEEPIDSTFEQSYEEMRQTEEELATDAAGEDKTPAQSGEAAGNSGKTQTSQQAGSQAAPD